MRRTIRYAALALSLTSVVAASSLKALQAQTPMTGTFITKLGKDTVAIEQYTRTEAGLVGDYVTREGRSVVNHYAVHFTADGNPGHVILTQTYADGSAIPGYPKGVQLTIGPTESVIEIDRDSIVTRKFEMSKTLPLLGTSFGMLELAFARLRAQKVDSGAFPGLPLDSRVQPDPIPVRFFATDSARVWTTDGAMYLRVDATGKILGLSGRATTQPFEARRVPTLDMKKLLASLAATEAKGNSEKQ
ncbi:MAG: hypothetical protein ABJC26_12530 [Gemmatimonadaceae bacterium]